MKKKIGFILPIIVMIFSIFNVKEVYATNYITWMQISDGSQLMTRNRWFDAGTNVIQISFDSWNSSICTSSSDHSYVTVNIVNADNYRNYGYKTATSRLNTSSQLNYGSVIDGNYYYYFITATASGEIFCGYNSNRVYMETR